MDLTTGCVCHCIIYLLLHLVDAGAFFCNETRDNFTSIETIGQRDVVALPSREVQFSEWIFPNSLRFPCSGQVTKWIFQANPRIDDNTSWIVPEWRIYRAVTITPSDTDYSVKYRSGSLEELNVVDEEKGIFEYNLMSPIQIKDGDVVGMAYEKIHEESLLQLSFVDMENQETSYYRQIVNNLFDINNSLIIPDTRYMPLVTAVMVDSGTSTSSSMVVPSVTASVRLSPSTTISGDISSSSMHPTPTPTPINDQNTPVMPVTTDLQVTTDLPVMTIDPTMTTVMTIDPTMTTVMTIDPTMTTMMTIDPTMTTEPRGTTDPPPTDDPVTSELPLTTDPPVTTDPSVTTSSPQFSVVIGTTLAGLLLVVVILLVVLVLIILKKKKQKFSIPKSEYISPLDNPVYQVGGDDNKSSEGVVPVYATLEDDSQFTSTTPLPLLNGHAHEGNHDVISRDSGHSYSTAFTGAEMNTSAGENGTVGSVSQARNGSIPQYEMVEVPGNREIKSSLIYHELEPTRTDQIREPQDYALPIASGHSTMESQFASGHSTMESQPYEVPVQHISNRTTNHQVRSEEARLSHGYRVLEQGIYVPTERERELYMSRSDMLTSGASNGHDDDAIYSMMSQKYKQLPQTSFFVEENIYWKPASNKTALYDQLSNKKYREILRPQIQIIKHLGSGQFGTVNMGHWEQTGDSTEVAVKTLKPQSTEDDKVKFLQEAAIMGQFIHANVVMLYGVVTMGEPVMIVLEYMQKGDMRKYLLSRQPKPNEIVDTTLPHLLLKFCREIASGMDYLSRKSFVHRDLAARNILISAENTCKIGDFGMSRDLEDNDYYITRGGQIPVKWTSPEALHFRKYSTASDVWSYGAVMYEIWSVGRKPFDKYNNAQTIQLVSDGYRLPPPPGCPRALYELMIRCWHSDAIRRPVFSAIVKMLSHSDSHLLSWNSKDLSIHPQVTFLGGPSKVSEDLYQELQDYYINKNKGL